MHLARLKLSGFRNLDCEVEFSSGFALLAGENNAGKSNVVDALRLLLYAEAGPSAQLYPTPTDFAHDADGNRIADTFTVEALFEGMNELQQGRMLTCVSPQHGKDTARLSLRARLLSPRRVRTEFFGGDHDSDIEQMARFAVQYTYLPPLRDAEAELRPGRRNRLLMLLSALVRDEEGRKEIEALVDSLNKNLAKGAVETAKQKIQARLDEFVGPRFQQQVSLAFTEPEFERIAGSLRALIGETTPSEMFETGLGFNNLLFIATVLAGLAEEPEAALHVLLVEEPEAHLHPQLQELLMRYLQRRGEERVQVLATTHSPNLASSVSSERMTVMTRAHRGAPITARPVAHFGLTEKELLHLGRFLDVTKASLLFARGVLLVEGVAEQILAPDIAAACGASLSEAGVAVINVGGLAFGPFAALFGSDKLPYRCAIVTDGDPPSVSEDPDHSQDAVSEDEAPGNDLSLQNETAISATATKLKTLAKENVDVFVAVRTFEWDLVAAGNWKVAIDALARLRPKVAAGLTKDYADAPPEQQAAAVLEKIVSIKGPFAQALVEELNEGATLAVPDYLARAIAWVTGSDRAQHAKPPEEKAAGS